MFSFRHIAHTLASYRCVTPLVLTPAVLMAGLVFAADPKPIYESPIVSAETKGHSVAIDVPLNGAKELYLVVSDAGDGFGCDWADWIEPNPHHFARSGQADGSQVESRGIGLRAGSTQPQLRR